jgi:hypothetical protein
MTTLIAEAGACCAGCGVDLAPLFELDRSQSRQYLLAKGQCCQADCKNCPYPESDRRVLRHSA